MTLLIAITGGSGSGKSTLAQVLEAALRPGTSAVISEDWYYRDLAEEAGFDPLLTDFDDLAVRDHELLMDHLRRLAGGSAVITPRYDFHRHARRPGGVPQSPVEVLIAEGSHLLCRSELASLFDLSIFVETPADIRLLRRLVRDQRERGRSQASVLAQYLRTVRPAHERLTEPSKARAHHVLKDDCARIEAPEPCDLLHILQPVLRDPRLGPFLVSAAPTEP